jgi:DNA-binding CsgD family transcriptional regulator
MLSFDHPTPPATGPAPATAPLREPAGPAALAAADALRQGLLLFDRQGAVLAANRAARAAIGRSEAALVPVGRPDGPPWRLRLPRAPLQQQLDRSLHALGLAGDAGIADADPTGGPARILALTEASQRSGLILRLLPLPLPLPLPQAVGVGDSARRATAIGAIIDRQADLAVDPALLRRLFGLTDAEARVARAYMTVDTVKDVARDLGISANTVKKHLSAVYEKTDCARQAQLIRLLMSLA